MRISIIIKGRRNNLAVFCTLVQLNIYPSAITGIKVNNFICDSESLCFLPSLCENRATENNDNKDFKEFQKCRLCVMKLVCGVKYYEGYKQSIEAQPHYNNMARVQLSYKCPC